MYIQNPAIFGILQGREKTVADRIGTVTRISRSIADDIASTLAALILPVELPGYRTFLFSARRFGFFKLRIAVTVASPRFGVRRSPRGGGFPLSFLPQVRPYRGGWRTAGASALSRSRREAIRGHER
jgi:hypothetical protein